MSLFNVNVGSLDLPSKIKACKPESTLRLAIYTLQKHHVGCVIITNENREILGIFTERDILTKVINKDVDLDTELVKDYMTPHPTCMSVDDGILDILEVMNLGGFRHMIILDEKEQLRSLISIKDLVDKMVDIIRSKGL